MVTVVVCEFIVLPLLHKIKFLNSKLEVIFTLLYKKKMFNLGFIFCKLFTKNNVLKKLFGRIALCFQNIKLFSKNMI